jgi:xanthine dehydrogenase YagT iron-sulfur-binding subunit
MSRHETGRPLSNFSEGMAVHDSKSDPKKVNPGDITRREFNAGVTGIALLSAASTEIVEARETPAIAPVQCSLNINGKQISLTLDARVTLLDLLRERLSMTGTKKGCDHGQCGACTILVNGNRVNSCLALAVAYDGDKITSIEGLSSGDQLHPMQDAFIEHDGFQCGFCTPGQICSAVAALDEWRNGVPSAMTHDLTPAHPIELTDDEIRERMAGNICRCGAYPNIVAAVRAVSRLEGHA